jgi:uncharacterized membrane protein YfcA
MDFPHLSPTQWTLAVLTALCVGVAKGGVTGLGLFSVLLMAEVVPARESTGLLLPLLVCGDVLSVIAFRKHAQWLYIGRTLPPAVLGIVLGWAVMDSIPDGLFAPLIGWIVLALALLQAIRGLRPQTLADVPHTRAFAWFMGGLSGVITMLANAAGPVMALYFLAVRLPRYEFVGTTAWFFLIVNVLKLPFSWQQGLIDGGSLALDLVLCPAVAAGILAGKLLLGKLPQRLFEWIVLALAALAALRLAWVW